MSSKNAIGEFDFATAPWWPSLQAAVVRPDTTLASIQAQCSLGPILSRSSLSIDTYCRWWLSDRSSSTASTSTIPIVLVVLLMIGIDLWVAHSIERIGQLCLAKEDMDQEKTIQQTLLPESIQPKYRHIFPITADSTTMAVLSQAQLPSVAALLYFLSPVPFLAGTVFASYQSIMYGLLLWAVRQSMEGPRTNPSEMALSLVMVATTMEPFIIIIAIPIYLSLRQQQQHRRDDDDSRMAQLFLVFLGLWAVVVVGFICYTTHPVEGQSWYGIFLDMAFPTFHRPNLGLQWYLQMQLFDRFRDYFAYMIRMLPYLLVLPITIRLYRYPLVLTTSFCFLHQLFHPAPTLLDLNVTLCLMLLCPRSLARTRIVSLVALCAIPVPVTVFVLDSWSWQTPGTGNANYVYFMCLAYNIFVFLLFLDFCGASVRRDKAIRLAWKEKDADNNNNKKQPDDIVAPLEHND